jgi:peroxiredoxin
MKIGDQAPNFSLPGVDGKTHSLSDLTSNPVLVVVQMCNHCPYVIKYEDRMIDLAKRYAAKEVAFVGICSNDTTTHPADSFENMGRHALEVGLPFPYLHDESQQVAKAYGAERTPEFFVFDAARKLVYHGRLDDHDNDPAAATKHYLADGIEAALAGRPAPVAEVDAVGCTVKWR